MVQGNNRKTVFVKCKLQRTCIHDLYTTQKERKKAHGTVGKNVFFINTHQQNEN